MKPTIAGIASVKLPAKASIISLPIIVALFLLAVGGLFLLNHADAQARDTIRKHHLEDIEHALYFAEGVHGTYPPYDQSSWCGELRAPGNETVRAQVEEALRTQNEAYANPDKPFPHDPRAGTVPDYFYWKRSPAVFELYATLEADPTGERAVTRCEAALNHAPYDYGITSLWREG